MPSAVLASLLDHLADEVGTEAFETRPAEYRQALARAAGDDPAAEFLRSLAALIRERQFRSHPDMTELPLSDWEASGRFPLTSAFVSSMVSGEYDSVDEALDEVLTSEHPDCHERLGNLAGELQRILYLFRTPAEFDAAFATLMPYVTHARVRHLLDAVHAHFAEQHWTPCGRTSTGRCAGRTRSSTGARRGGAARRRRRTGSCTARPGRTPFGSGAYPR
ncbi:hypothetical protein ACFY8F_04915 [Streptomyces tanashiensis]|uniref:hypothetical protein n=1 Tax=Streptomyces tanashiensis TaxID=67367 RepID=UPI0036B14214